MSGHDAADVFEIVAVGTAPNLVVLGLNTAAYYAGLLPKDALRVCATISLGATALIVAASTVLFLALIAHDRHSRDLG